MDFTKRLKDNDLYQRYKDDYTVFWNTLVVSKRLTLQDISIVESNFQNWEIQKLMDRNKSDYECR